jgi:hypothetical protein
VGSGWVDWKSDGPNLGRNGARSATAPTVATVPVRIGHEDLATTRASPNVMRDAEHRVLEAQEIVRRRALGGG